VPSLFIINGPTTPAPVLRSTASKRSKQSASTAASLFNRKT
jgi:hypothetical protein